jgi:predicted TIM-barrel fold metal-dependent hydrolase
MTSVLPQGIDRDNIWSGPVIDCDVHANVPSLETLFQYQDPVWVQWALERGWKGPAGVQVVYPAGAPTTAREEWRHEGQVPASDLTLLQSEILDPWRTERAVVNCYYAVDSLRHPDWAAALARSVNDWLIEEWLEKDDRLVGSMVIPARDPAAAAEEIARVGGHPRIVQVLMPVRSERLYGQRIFYPLLDAIAEHDLVMGLHWGGTAEAGPTTSGFPSWYVEEYAGETQVFAAQMISLVSEGTFRRYPKLHVSMLESGFTWLPPWGWRLNKEWKGLRNEIPWVDRPPLDIIRDHFRFSIAPLDSGPPEEMAKLIEWLGSEDLLMFATDYPHRHDDDVKAFLEILSPTMRNNVMAETARNWYHLAPQVRG